MLAQLRWTPSEMLQSGPIDLVTLVSMMESNLQDLAPFDESGRLEHLMGLFSSIGGVDVELGSIETVCRP